MSYFPPVPRSPDARRSAPPVISSPISALSAMSNSVTTPIGPKQGHHPGVEAQRKADITRPRRSGSTPTKPLPPLPNEGWVPSMPSPTGSVRPRARTSSASALSSVPMSMSASASASVSLSASPWASSPTSHTHTSSSHPPSRARTPTSSQSQYLSHSQPPSRSRTPSRAITPATLHLSLLGGLSATLSGSGLGPVQAPTRRARATSMSGLTFKAPAATPPPLPVPRGPVPTPVHPSISARERYDTFEACMEGAIKFETQAAALGHTGDLAERLLNRAAGLFAAALSHQPSSSWARLRRAAVLQHLAGTGPPVSSIVHLSAARALLISLPASAPNASSARAALAIVSARLSAYLHLLDDCADDENEVWEGDVGRFACEALEALEDVAAERMDRVRMLRRDAFEGEAPALADMFLALAEAAGKVATLATDAETVDSHAELAEHALDQAANMAAVAAAAAHRARPSSSGAALITRVQLASGKAAAERMRHLFLLGVPLAEDDFAGLIADMGMLGKDARERAARLKGTKGAAAAAQAFEALRLLGDTQMLYANLVRCVWRARRHALVNLQVHTQGLQLDSAPPTPTPTTPGLVLDGRTRTGSMSSVLTELESPPIPEEPELEDMAGSVASLDAVMSAAASTLASLSPTPMAISESKRRRAPPPPLTLVRPHAIPPLQPTAPPVSAPRTPLSPLNPSSQPALLRRATDAGIPRPRPLPSAGFHGSSQSWRTPVGTPGVSSIPPLPSPTPQTGSVSSSPTTASASPTRIRRRLSSMARPLNAWDGPMLSPLLSPGFSENGRVPTAELTQTAYSLLASALKHYKVALTLLSQSEVGLRRAELKSEVLASIASASLFSAMLAPRVACIDKPKALLNTAEVYSTWAAREVGWSFIIEGTPSAVLADRRAPGGPAPKSAPGSWEADEAGKRAVLLTLRIWWYRGTADVGSDKSAAKESVARVVKRLRDIEGVTHGDVARFIASVVKIEGELDPVEHLFWRSVKRILRGGQPEGADAADSHAQTM